MYILENAKKYFIVLKIILTWYKVSVHFKLKLLDFLLDSSSCIHVYTLHVYLNYSGTRVLSTFK